MRKAIILCLLALTALCSYAVNSFKYAPQASNDARTPVTVTGRVVDFYLPDTGIEGVDVMLSASNLYVMVTDAQGYFVAHNVESNITYEYTLYKYGYQGVTGTFFVGDGNANMGILTMQEVVPEPGNVVAAQSLNQNLVSLVWLPAEDNPAYKVWRLIDGDEYNEAQWTLLTSTAIMDTSYIDTQWSSVSPGTYRYAVKAIYPNSALSEPVFSNYVIRGSQGILSGIVRESGSNIPIPGAMVSAGASMGHSNASGEYAFLVPSGTHNVSCYKNGFQPYMASNIAITENVTTTCNILMIPNTIMPTGVFAQQVLPNVHLSWSPPGTGDSEWIHHDSGQNANSVGTGGAADFDVAVRFPPSVMQDYAGMQLYAVKVWPAQSGNFAVRVWRGGNATAPGVMVANQIFAPVLGVYNTVMLNSPVPITGAQELWFGYRCVVSGGFPAGCDGGPAVNGFGNMLRYEGQWSTLLAFNDDLDANWNIQGYVGFAPPANAPEVSEITLGIAREDFRNPTYKVWRLHPGEENSTGSWLSLTPAAISATSYVDTDWMDLPYDTYKWAVRAVYGDGFYSEAAFSNALAWIPQVGTITGLVRSFSLQLLAGATVVCGDVSATTNSNGAFSMEVAAGNHSLTASHPYYGSLTHNGILVTAGGITSVTFQLPPFSAETFESYPNFAVNFMPWTTVDVDFSPTLGIGESTWDNIHNPMAFMVFNPGATVPPLTELTAHIGAKMACSFGLAEGQNDDWLISPPLYNLNQIKFWGRSALDNAPLARFRIGASYTGVSPEDFSFISGVEPLDAPAQWTEFIFNIPENTAPVYIGIQCVTQGSNVLCIDDFYTLNVAGYDPVDVPMHTALLSNYPNPFNPQTTISYSLKNSAQVKIDIYNAKGQLVKHLEDASKPAGEHHVVWDGRNSFGKAVSSGVFYYRMKADGFSHIRKMIMLK